MASASIVFLVYSIQRSTYLDDKYQLFSILFPHETNFDESIKNLGMTEYITPKEIEANSGKNIIVISLESFELGYLHELEGAAYYHCQTTSQRSSTADQSSAARVVKTLHPLATP
jgi:hypothetical protein